MSPETLLHEADRALRDLLPEQTAPARHALAAVLCGVVRAHAVVLSRQAVHLPGWATALSKQRRAQRLLATPHLDVARAPRRLLGRVLATRRGRVEQQVDAVTRGAGGHQAGTVSLVLAVAWHRRALPLLWHTWAADAPDQDWAAGIQAMVAAIQAELPPGVEVVVLVDRGLSGAERARAVLDAGPAWHFLWRVIRTTRVQRPDGTIQAIGDLVAGPGARVSLSGTHVYAPRRKVRAGAGGWDSDWRQAVAAKVVAVWRRDGKDPWLLVTDLPACGARRAEDRRRTWEEELFRDLKRLGWQWQRSQVRVPARVDRLLLVLALPPFWMLAVAQRVVRRGGRCVFDAHRHPTLSAFQFGLRWCEQELDAHRFVPCHLTLWPQVAADLKLS
jgi:hypothetical protein